MSENITSKMKSNLNQPLPDHELLEAAAKAIGVKIDKSATNGGGQGNTGFDLMGNAMLDWHNNVKWNPLKDDGDALRLAVKLGLSIGTPRYKGFGSTCGNHTVFRDDPFYQTRLAIVLAAASIGETYNHSVP